MLVYREYQDLTENKALSYQRTADILKELEVIGFLGGKNPSKGRG